MGAAITMAKLVLLNVLLFLLVALGSSTSIAWPSYSDDTERDSLSAELEKENRHAVANLYYRDDAEVATYGDNADTADDDMAVAAHNRHTIAEINRRRKRKR